MTALPATRTASSLAIPMAIPAIAIIAFAALAIQLQAYPNHDVAWVLWGTREMVAGAVFGRDIVEPNPPLAWYLAMGPVWLAGRIGLPVAAGYQIGVAMAALGALVAFRGLVAGAADERSLRLPVLVMAVSVLLLPHRDFGQREHLTLIAVLPYLGLAAARWRGAAPGTGVAVAVGLAAGIGLALKPWFLAVPLLIELGGMLRTRRLLAPFRPECWAMGAVVGLYGLYLLAVDRTWIDTAVPLASAIYWSFEKPLAATLVPLVPPLLVAAAAIRFRRDHAALPAVAALAAFGFAFACLAQAKGYSYHLLPVWACAATAVAAAIPDLSARSPRAAAAWLALALVLFSPVQQAARWWAANRPAGDRSEEVRALTAAVDAHAQGGHFLAVSVHPFPGFPTALYAKARWAARTNSQWFLPAVAQLRQSGEDPTALAFAERQARAFILHDLATRPGLVIIDTDARRHTDGPADFDFLAFYREDARFRAAWAPYRETTPIGRYRMFVRETAK